MDPRVKILAVMALSIIIMQADLIALAGVAFLLLLCVYVACLPVSALLSTLRPVLPLFSFLFLFYIFFTPGQPWLCFPLCPVQATYEGVSLGTQQVGRFVLLVAAASLLTLTTPTVEITLGLERLLSPLGKVGLSSHDIAMMISLALRLVPLLADEMKNLRDAQIARGSDLGQNSLRGKIRSIIYLAGPLCFNLSRRCDELADAMEARGYQPGSRTYLCQLVLNRTDYLIIATLVVITLVALIVRP